MVGLILEFGIPITTMFLITDDFLKITGELVPIIVLVIIIYRILTHISKKSVIGHQIFNMVLFGGLGYAMFQIAGLTTEIAIIFLAFSAGTAIAIPFKLKALK